MDLGVFRGRIFRSRDNSIAGRHRLSLKWSLEDGQPCDKLKSRSDDQYAQGSSHVKPDDKTGHRLEEHMFNPLTFFVLRHDFTASRCNDNFLIRRCHS